MLAANKQFWGRKLGYINGRETITQLSIFNENASGSYHPLSAQAMGETYGDLELHDFIGINDYLGQSPAVDEFIRGVAIGRERAAKRKKGPGNKAGKDPFNAIADKLTKG